MGGPKKLTLEQAQLIRRLHLYGASRKTLAETFEVSLNTIHSIVNGETHTSYLQGKRKGVFLIDEAKYQAREAALRTYDGKRK